MFYSTVLGNAIGIVAFRVDDAERFPEAGAYAETLPTASDVLTIIASLLLARIIRADHRGADRDRLTERRRTYYSTDLAIVFVVRSVAGKKKICNLLALVAERRHVALGQRDRHPPRSGWRSIHAIPCHNRPLRT